MLEIFIKVAVAITIIIITARILSEIMPYIKQPRVVGEMIAGVILGPTLLGYFFPKLSNSIFPQELMPFIFVIGNIGLSIYMFIVGMEIDLQKIDKKIIQSSLLLSLSAILFPFLSSIFIVNEYYYILVGSGNVNRYYLMVFIGTAFAITAFPMLARILQEKKIVETRLGSIMLLSASVQDVFSWIMLSFVTSVAATGKMLNGVFTVVGFFLFLVLAKYFIKPILNRLSIHTKNENKLSQNSFAIVFIILIICTVITDKIGLYSVFGGFILGIFMPRNPLFISEIKVRLHDFMIVFFLPIFFAYSGLKTNLNQLVSAEYLVPCLLILLCGIVFKIIPIFCTMRIIGYSNHTSLAIGGLMNARGLMELIIANIGISYGIINAETFSIIVLLAIISTFTATPILEFATRYKPIEE